MSIKINSLINKELSFTPYDVNWISNSSRLCAVGATKQGTGKIAVYGLNENQLLLKTETETNYAMRCCTITGQNRNLATGDFDGQLHIWDTQRLDIPLVSIKAHDSMINAIDSYNQLKEPQEIVTGSRDGAVKVWDTRQTEKAILTIKSNKDSKDIWAVCYGLLEGHRVIAVGYENGDIKLFQVSGSKYLWESHVEDGICSMEFSEQSLLVSTVTSAYMIDIKSGQSTKIQSTPDTTLWSIRQIPQDANHFAIAAGDGNLSIFNKKTLKPMDTLALSKHPIISLNWHKDKKGLFACSSFDETIKIGMLQYSL